MSIDTRHLESGARIRAGSPSATPSTNGQSDMPFAQFLSAAESRPSTQPDAIGTRIEDKLVMQRRNDASAQARRQIERERSARNEDRALVKPAERTADDAKSAQSAQSSSTAVSDPPNQPDNSAQRAAENRQRTSNAQGRGPREPQQAKAPRGPQDPDRSDASHADATQSAQARPAAGTDATPRPEGTGSSEAKASTVQKTDPARDALPQSASVSLDAIDDDQSEEGEAGSARKKALADLAVSEAAATPGAKPIPDAVMVAAAQTMLTSGSDKSVPGNVDSKPGKPGIDTTTDAGATAQSASAGAPATGDAGAAGGGARLGAGPGTTSAAGHSRHGPGRPAADASGAALPQTLRDAKATDAANPANAGAVSASDTAARTLTDNSVLSLTSRPQTDGPQGPALARLTDQGMAPPASFAALLRSAEGPGETRSEALNRPQNFPITVPFDDPRFGSALSERVQWLVKEGIQSAELTLHPQDMGPIRIELSIDGSAASIDFAATQAETRAAIEQALPRLRDLLAEQGLQLGGTQIGADTRRQDHPGHRARPSGGETRTATVAIPDATSDGLPVSAMTAPGRNASGRIDLFA
jgi:flagellar hook-length control protein FliK